jgi:hypothetical protein
MRLTESEKNDILNQYEKDLKRRTTDTHIKSFDLIKYKSLGLTPYYFNRDTGKDFGLVEFTKPLTGYEFNNRPKEVFLLKPDEYEKVNKVVENIKEMIELHNKKISLLKDMVPAIMNELTKK